MSQEPKSREATPRAEASPKRKRRSKKINWDKVKVFAEPEYRVPWQLQQYSKGRGSAPAEPWIQAAIESGLAVMEPQESPSDWLEPLGDNPPARMSQEDLQALVDKGLQEIWSILKEDK